MYPNSICFGPTYLNRHYFKANVKIWYMDPEVTSQNGIQQFQEPCNSGCLSPDKPLTFGMLQCGLRAN